MPFNIPLIPPPSDHLNYLLCINDLYDFCHTKFTYKKTLKRLGLFKRHLVVKIHLYVLWNKSWTDESIY